MPWRECSNSTMYQASSGGTQATRGSNSNNNNNNGAIIMIKVIARVHPVHLMHADWAPGGRQPSEQANRLGLSPLSAITIVPGCPKLYIAVAIVINTIIHGVIRTWVLSHRSQMCWTLDHCNLQCASSKLDLLSWNSLSTCSHILLGRVSVSV